MIVTVGKLFRRGITRYDEKIQFDISDSGADLYMYFDNPTKTEIANIRSGPLKAGYLKYDPAIFMLFKFGSFSWVDAPYAYHLSKHLTNVPFIPEGMGLMLNVYLINAANGILEAMRTVGLNHNLSKSLFLDMIEQGKKFFSFDDFDATVHNVYDTYTTKDLVKMGKFF